MTSIWVVLLDVSGSMAQGFSGKPSDDPMVETGRWSTKIQAAKELLGRQVRSTNVQDVAIITFGDSATKVFHGSRRDFFERESEFMLLEARSNRTNVAAAFDLVAVDPIFEHYDSLSVLVLSDGLANIGDPIASAASLIGKYRHARIDTILIDDTEQGRQIAVAFSINGWVRPATSLLQVDEGLRQSRSANLSQVLSRLGDERMAVANELLLLTEQTPLSVMIITSPLDLDARALSEVLGPAIGAIEGLQQVAAAARNRQYRGRVLSISQLSPISIDLAGLPEALNALLAVFVPWRRRYARELARLRLQGLRLKNRKIQAEIDELDARTRGISAEAERTAAQTRSRDEEALRPDEDAVRLQQMTHDLSRRVLLVLVPDDERMRERYSGRVLDHCAVLVGLPVEFELHTLPMEYHHEDES